MSALHLGSWRGLPIFPLGAMKGWNVKLRLRAESPADFLSDVGVA